MVAVLFRPRLDEFLVARLLPQQLRETRQFGPRQCLALLLLNEGEELDQGLLLLVLMALLHLAAAVLGSLPLPGFLALRGDGVLRAATAGLLQQPGGTH